MNGGLKNLEIWRSHICGPRNPSDMGRTCRDLLRLIKATFPHKTIKKLNLPPERLQFRAQTPDLRLIGAQLGL